MIYNLLRMAMRLVLHVYFRRIYLSGQTFANRPQPTILACNHPNSFLDAVLLAVLVKKPLHFLARSDVFNTPLKRWLLAQMHVIPIYRLEEGSGNLYKNQDTFAQCYEILRANGTILIFSEGICVLEKRLRALRKGTARLAFSAEEAYDFTLRVAVVPVTLNYTYPTQFRQEVIVGVAEPIPVANYRPLYGSHPAKAINALTQEIAACLKQNLIQIEYQKLETITEDVLRMVRTTYVAENDAWLSYSNQRLRLEQQAAANITNLYKNAPADFTALKQQMEQYMPLAPPDRALSAYFAVTGNTFFKTLLFVLGWPFFLTGVAGNFLPLWLAQFVTNRKVKKREFYSSVKVAIGFIFYLIYYVTVVLLTVSFYSIAGWLVAAGLPLSGCLAILYYDLWQTQKCFRRNYNSSLQQQQAAIIGFVLEVNEKENREE